MAATLPAAPRDPSEYRHGGDPSRWTNRWKAEELSDLATLVNTVRSKSNAP